MHASLIGKSYDQLCFVVDDIEAAIEYWRRVNGVETWDIVRDLGKYQTEKTYYGKEGDYQFSCAYGMAGSILIELAHHEGGSSVYDNWSGGPHHIGFRLPDAESYDAARAHYDAQGFEVAMSGYASGETGGCRWCYYDTRSLIGCYSELYCLEGAAPERFRRFMAGESNKLISPDD